MRHMFKSQFATSNNVRTVCGRIVAAHNSFTKNVEKVDCIECLANTHKNESFEATRIGRKGPRGKEVA